MEAFGSSKEGRWTISGDISFPGDFFMSPAFQETLSGNGMLLSSKGTKIPFERGLSERLYLTDRDIGALVLSTLNYGLVLLHSSRPKSLHGSAADVDVDGQVVGILSYSDSIPYSTTMLSVMRANFALFPISPRNSPQAVAHLIQKVGVKHMLVGFDQSMQELMERAVEFLKTEYGYRDDQIPATSMTPLFEDLYLKNGSDGKETVEKIREEIPLKRQQPQDIQFYLHSSGSTAFPKPVLIVSMHSIPMFHAMGMFHLAWVFTCGFVCATFPPQLPPVQPTPENVFNGAVKTDVDYIVCVPSLVEAWSQTPSYIDWLVTRKGILFGGGPLDKGVGDLLAAKGVQLLVVYGSLFLPMMVLMSLSWWSTYHLINITRILITLLHFYPNEHFTPRVFNTTINGVNAYATADLVIEHPQKKGYWKILGRVDSQIIHSSGEKTNPGPLESIMNQDPHVAASVMFGHGKFQAGIIIEPVKEEQFDPKDQVKLGEFTNQLWPTVEKMNDFAPQHSRIFKEMILVTSPSKPFTYTAKNTPRNNAIIKEYAPEIEAIYDSLEESTQSSIPVPAQWDLESSTEFVRAVVKKVLAIEDIGDDEDVFQRGVDTRESTSNFVYEHPTITSLARFIVLVAQRGTLSSLGDSEAQVERDVKAMRPMFEELCSCEVELGADELLQDETVERVYALVRNGGSSVDSPSIETKQLVLLEANLSREKFGLKEGVFEEVKSRVTHVVANAWRVDFNIGLSSFEADMKGLRYMVDLAVAKNALLIYISSIGVFQRYTYAKTRPFPEQHLPAQVASGGGYPQGKWVSEQIMQNASWVEVRRCEARTSLWKSERILEQLPALVRTPQGTCQRPKATSTAKYTHILMVFHVFRDWLINTFSAKDDRSAWVYVLASNNGKACKIGCTRRTPELRLSEWRRKHKSKGFRLVYSVQVSEIKMFDIEHEAHQQILKYADKIEGPCPDCPIEHREEFVFKPGFDSKNACDVVDTAKELVG
ncbi:acetyl-CoA synthetase-like protein [Dendrothele bispora CBS 962.96]|uniref:Acetyl-CoA synthetase-like protein n=1 Tax=Dendrothele bispora (strain CBS 962.96) TaxID=1314807 RepID=A0A4V4HEB7_DENBC|nr:acetyl-CoA synthetase-like protein [Dendrothele bispora CBS 962.96]